MPKSARPIATAPGMAFSVTNNTIKDAERLSRPVFAAGMQSSSNEDKRDGRERGYFLRLCAVLSAKTRATLVGQRFDVGRHATAERLQVISALQGRHNAPGRMTFSQRLDLASNPNVVVLYQSQRRHIVVAVCVEAG